MLKYNVKSGVQSSGTHAVRELCYGGYMQRPHCYIVVYAVADKLLITNTRKTMWKPRIVNVGQVVFFFPYKPLMPLGIIDSEDNMKLFKKVFPLQTICSQWALLSRGGQYATMSWYWKVFLQTFLKKELYKNNLYRYCSQNGNAKGFHLFPYIAASKNKDCPMARYKYYQHVVFKIHINP